MCEHFQVQYVRKHWKCPQLKRISVFFLNIKTARSTTWKSHIMYLRYSFLIPPPDFNLEHGKNFDILLTVHLSI